VQGRCGYGTRVPLLVISPYAKKNYIDHTLTDQTSVLRFIEDNWLQGARIQAGGSFDTIAGTIENMFSFPSSSTPSAVKAESRKLQLDPKTGSVVSH
jgi:phospholipase C